MMNILLVHHALCESLVDLILSIVTENVLNFFWNLVVKAFISTLIILLLIVLAQY